MMRLFTTILLVLLCGGIGSVWAGGNRALDGHSLPWGAPIEEFPELTEYKVAGGITYFQSGEKKGADCDFIAGIESSHVAYGFQNGKLYARIVRIDTLEDFEKAHDHLVDLYGEPKEKMDDTTHVDKWKTADLKIKLKYNKDTKLMKLGTYHVPTAGKEFDVEKSFDAAP